MARALPLLALLLADAALAQVCLTAELMSVQEIVATCCESAVDGSDCGTVFPATCSHSCARLVVPYIDSCGTMLRALPDEAFPGLHIAGCAIIFYSTADHVAAVKGTVRRRLAAPVIFTAKSNSFLTVAVFTSVRFVTFSEACRQTLVLYESADSELCSSSSDQSVLQSRVDIVNAACCEQGGVNTCVGGAPQTCKVAGLHRQTFI